MTPEPTRRPRGRPKTFDRARTLEVAVDSYWRDGIDAVSVNEICRRAGVAKPGVYREFGDEDHLMDAVLTEYHAKVLTPILAALERDRPFRVALNDLITMMTRPARDGSPAGCLIAKMRSARPRLGPVTVAHIDRIRTDTIAAYTAWVQRAVERGEIRLPESIDMVASYIDAQLTMLLNRVAAGDDPETVRTHARLAFAVITGPDAD